MSGFERQYVLRSFSMLALGAAVNDRINQAVAECDHERAAASIACMTCSDGQLHILIEKWRDVGDAEQDTTRAMDTAAAPRKSRRTRAHANDNPGTTARVEPESVNLPLGPSEVSER